MNKQNPPNSNNEEANIDEEALSFVSQQYQNSDLPEPSLAIDTAILQQAKTELFAKNKASQTARLAKWRHWQFGGSIAASVAIVVLVLSFSDEPANQDIEEYASAPFSAPSTNIERSSETEELNEPASNEAIFDMAQLTKEADKKAMAMKSKRLNIARARQTQSSASDLLAQLVNMQAQLGLTHQQVMSMTFDKLELGEIDEFKANIEQYKQTQDLLFITLSESKANNKKTSFNEQYKAVMSAEQWQALHAEP